MSAEYAILLDCPVRRAEAPDLVAATQALRRQVKAGTMLEVMRSLAQKQGKLPFEISIQHRVQTANGTESRDVTWHEVKAQCDGFEAKCAPCEGCPANLLGRAFGCSGAVKYPLTEGIERWICERVQPPDTVGGLFLSRAIEDLGYDGSFMASWRTREDLFERRTPVIVPGTDGKISADNILHAIFGVGSTLGPEHCLMVLVWLGLVAPDGEPLGGPEHAARLQTLADTLPGDARRAASGFMPGPPTKDVDLVEIQTLFEAMYQAWCAGASLWIDA